MKLLYVEDNRINAILFEEALKVAGGFELRIAEDGAQAEALVDEWLPDVLVLDAHLPDTSGTALLQRLRRRPACAGLPAFMCSADALPEDIRSALDAGFAGYWTKPLDLQQLLSDLRTLSAQR